MSDQLSTRSYQSNNTFWFTSITVLMIISIITIIAILSSESSVTTTNRDKSYVLPEFIECVAETETETGLKVNFMLIFLSVKLHHCVRKLG